MPNQKHKEYVDSYSSLEAVAKNSLTSSSISCPEKQFGA